MFNFAVNKYKSLDFICTSCGKETHFSSAKYRCGCGNNLFKVARKGNFPIFDPKMHQTDEDPYQRDPKPGDGRGTPQNMPGNEPDHSTINGEPVMEGRGIGGTENAAPLGTNWRNPQPGYDEENGNSAYLPTNQDTPHGVMEQREGDSSDFSMPNGGPLDPFTERRDQPTPFGDIGRTKSIIRNRPKRHVSSVLDFVHQKLKET